MGPQKGHGTANAAQHGADILLGAAVGGAGGQQAGDAKDGDERGETLG